MERLEQRQEILKKALNSLEEILQRIQTLKPADKNYLPFRDSSIQRFKYSVDTFWKFLKEYLDKKHGITTMGSPKAVIKAAAEINLIDKESFPHFVAMIDDRNMTSHTY